MLGFTARYHSSTGLVGDQRNNDSNTTANKSVNTRPPASAIQHGCRRLNCCRGSTISTRSLREASSRPDARATRQNGRTCLPLSRRQGSSFRHSGYLFLESDLLLGESAWGGTIEFLRDKDMGKLYKQGQAHYHYSIVLPM